MKNQIQTLRDILSVFPQDAKAIFHLAISDISIALAESVEEAPDCFDKHLDLATYMHELIYLGKKASNRQLQQAEDLLAEELEFFFDMYSENALFADIIMCSISAAIDTIADWNEQKILGSMKDDSDFISQSVVLRDAVLEHCAEKITEKAKEVGVDNIEEIKEYILTLCDFEEEEVEYDEDFEEDKEL